MASARLQALLDRRSRNLYLSSGRIRLLTPANNSIATIAKRTITSELEIMQRNYNAGLVSNADFKAFLEKMLTTPGVSDVDKNEIQTQIKDFDSRILGDQLVQRFRSAPDNTLEQVNSAQALANYFRQRASTMQPDTPAYNDNINNAIAYEQKVADINENVQKVARQNRRYILEQKVNQIPSGTSENASAKAEMWKELYNQALTDGDVTAANQYASYYEKEVTKAEELSTKEVEKENKKTLSDFINTTLNDYHDGKITGEQALSQLQEADKFAYETGDIAAQNRLNSLSVTINREIEKGITYSSEGGLSVKSKGGGTGGGEMYLNPDGSVSYGGGTVSTPSTGGGKTVNRRATNTKTNNFTNGNTTPKSFSQLDLEYKNELIEANKALVNGEITPKEYQQSILLLTKSRQIDLQNITQGLGQILEANPNAKIGKKEIKTLFNEYSGQLTGVTSEYNGIRTGNLVLVMSTENVENPAGTKFTTPQLQFVAKNKIPQNSVDVNGIYYPTRFSDITFTDKNLANQYVKTHPDTMVTQDATGNFIITDKEGNIVQQQYLDVTDSEGNVITYENDPKYGYIPVSVGPQTDALRKQIIKEADQAIKEGKIYKQNLMSYNELVGYKPGQPAGITTFPEPKEPNFAQKAISGVVPAIQSGVEAVKEAVEPLVVAPLPAAPKLEVAPAQSLGITPSTGISKPQSLPVPSTGQAIAPSKPATNLSIAGTKPATTIPLPKGEKPKPIPAPNVPSNISQQVKQAQQRDVSITGSLKALGNKLFGWTGFKF